MEFDFGFFEGAGIDPTGVEFVINLDCKPGGGCSDRERLVTTWDTQTKVVDLPTDDCTHFHPTERSLESA